MAILTPRKPKRRPGPPKGQGGRPKADADKVREGVRLVVEDDLTCEEAGERVGLGGNTIRRAWKASLAGAEGGAIVVDAPAGGLELVILVGMPASGKSTLCRERFPSHVRLNGDTAGGADLSELAREDLAAGRSVVIDNTNATAEERGPWLALARGHGARTVGVLLETSKADALARNAFREGAARVPDVAIHTIAKKLVPPRVGEGFDALFVARMLVGGGFEVVEGEARLPLTLPEGVAGLVFQRADVAKVASLRAMVTAGGPDGLELGADFVASVALGEECTASEVRALLLEAAAEASLDALPYELAVERSIATAERARKKAESANDWKSMLLCVQHIDRLRFGKREPDPEGLTRAEVLILLRRMVEAVQGIAGAVDALRAALPGDE
jgi:predicted kinase